jgi:hypothetical protein
MVAVVTNSNGQPDRSDEDRERRLRNRNIAVAAVLGALVVLFYVVAIVKMSGS